MPYISPISPRGACTREASHDAFALALPHERHACHNLTLTLTRQLTTHTITKRVTTHRGHGVRRGLCWRPSGLPFLPSPRAPARPAEILAPSALGAGWERADPLSKVALVTRRPR
eukprot:scaffold16995_cov127-Isochrysis_galbana.AAC.5